MSVVASSSVDQRLALLDDVISASITDVAESSVASRVDAIAVFLREADRLTAAAVELLHRGGVEAVSSLPVELFLAVQARRTPGDARMIMIAAEQLRLMPALSRAFSCGWVSWSQVRSITLACSKVLAPVRSACDRLIGEQAEALCDADPDRLVQLVEDEIARHRERAEVTREDRLIERGFFALQRKLEGGARFWGEMDEESTAILEEAVDTLVAPPSADVDDELGRGRQRLDAVIYACERVLAGESPTRPTPRMLVCVDARQLAQDAESSARQLSIDASARLLWPLAGRAPRLTRVALETLSCDATLTPVVFDGERSVAVGDTARTVSEKLRAAVVARDGGCRFPGCRAPAAWSDVHHIVSGYGNTADDMILLCRRCHRRIHRTRWNIRWDPNGALCFSRLGRRYHSTPQHRAPPTHGP